MHDIERGLVEEEVLQPRQGTLGVHGPALLKHVAVALEVVARSPGAHKHGEGKDVVEGGGGAARGGVQALLARNLAQTLLVRHLGKQHCGFILTTMNT